MKKILIAMCGMMLLTACEQAVEEESVDVIADFELFYKRFHDDTAFQLAHIQFPLEGISSDPDQYSPGFRWYKEDWMIHQPIVSSSGFSSDFSWLGDELVVERITNKAGTYGMERRFARLDGMEWSLIYYADLHPINNPS